jgi:catechol 2,3-dioxygenase-like lactoylglutathione lyase family enzyme
MESNMPAELTGPDFVAFTVRDLEQSRSFWTETIGLRPAAKSPPGAHVFETRPIPFAIRLLRPSEPTGAGGVAVWFAYEGNLDAYAALLSGRNVQVSPIQPGPFGRFFVFVDPEDRSVTVHERI